MGSLVSECILGPAAHTEEELRVLLKGFRRIDLVIELLTSAEWGIGSLVDVDRADHANNRHQENFAYEEEKDDWLW